MDLRCQSGFDVIIKIHAVAYERQLKTLRPTTSYTVPPGTVFTTTPLSYMPPAQPSGQSKGKGKAPAPAADAEMGSSVESEEEEKGPQRTTLVGVKTGQRGNKEKEGGELWIWRGEDNQKTSVSVRTDTTCMSHWMLLINSWTTVSMTFITYHQVDTLSSP